MRSAIAVVALAALCAVVLMFDRYHRRAVSHVTVNTSLDLPPKQTNKPMAKASSHLLARTNAVDDVWTNCSDGVDVLLRYIPEANENQKRAAQEFVYHSRSRRSTWAKEANEIKTRAEQLNDPAVTETTRLEVRRVIDAEWAAFTASVKGMAKQLDEVNQKFFAKYGFTDPNLQSDLYSLGNPPGKEPWEE